MNQADSEPAERAVSLSIVILGLIVVLSATAFPLLEDFRERLDRIEIRLDATDPASSQTEL